MSRVAIITRTIDRPVLLERTLQSILGQTCQDWHWVIVDGGNTEAVPHLLQSHGERIQGRVTHLRFANPKPGMTNMTFWRGMDSRLSAANRPAGSSS